MYGALDAELGPLGTYLSGLLLYFLQGIILMTKDTVDSFLSIQYKHRLHWFRQKKHQVPETQVLGNLRT